MKNIFTIAVASISIWSSAQNLPVSQTQNVSNILLEEFTGINCPNCPDGHSLVHVISDQLQEDLVVINYHATSNSIPNGDQPDFRTPEGNYLREFFGITGTPTGTINRGSFETGDFDRDANNWIDNINTERNFYSIANTALDVNINEATREASITVEVYYTNPSASGTDYLSIAYVENGIIGPQAAGSNNPNNYNSDGTYTHNHVFRGYIGESEGSPFTIEQGVVSQFEYTFTVPDSYQNTDININNLEFIAFVHNGENSFNDSDVWTSAKTAPSFYSASIDELTKNEFKIYPNPTNGEINIKGENKIDSINIIDITGKEVDATLNNNTVVINGNPGVYFLIINNKERIKVIKK